MICIFANLHIYLQELSPAHHNHALPIRALASIHYADTWLTTRSRELSKPRYSSLDFSNRSEIWQAPGSSVAELHVELQSDSIIIAYNLVAPRLHGI